MTKTTDIWKSREWSDYVAHTVEGYRRRSFSRVLNHHDWDDIRQTCLIHIWKKRGLYRRDRALKPWLKTVTLNQIQNAIRKRFSGFHSKQIAARSRWNVRNPQSLVTKTVYSDAMCEEIRYEPDAVDPRTLPAPVGPEDLGVLSQTEKQALHAFTRFGDPMDVLRHTAEDPSLKLKMKSRRKRDKVTRREYLRLFQTRRRLQERYAAALNSPR